MNIGNKVGRGLGAVGAAIVVGSKATGVHSLRFVQDVKAGAAEGYVDHKAALEARFALSVRLAAERKAPLPAPVTSRQRKLKTA